MCPPGTIRLSSARLPAWTAARCMSAQRNLSISPSLETSDPIAAEIAANVNRIGKEIASLEKSVAALVRRQTPLNDRRLRERRVQRPLPHQELESLRRFLASLSDRERIALAKHYQRFARHGTIASPAEIAPARLARIRTELQKRLLAGLAAIQRLNRNPPSPGEWM